MEAEELRELQVELQSGIANVGKIVEHTRALLLSTHSEHEPKRSRVQYDFGGANQGSTVE